MNRRGHRLVPAADPRVGALVTQQQSRIAELEAALRQALDLRAAFEAVVAREAAALPVIPAWKAPAGWEPSGAAVAMLDISDIHVGELVTESETGGLNRYDVQECRRRAEVLVRQALEILDLHQPALLYVNLLGDIVTGERIYRGQAWHLDAPLLRQIVEAEEILLGIIARLADAVPEVRVFTVAGNHGRAGKPGEYHPSTNFDVLVYVLLARRLAEQDRVTVHVGTAPWHLYDVPELGGQVHLMLHGDGIRSYLGVPYYGLERAVRDLSRTLAASPRYIHVGHFHKAANVDVPHGEYLLNGTWVGATAHGLKTFREGVAATQRLYLFGEDGLRCAYRIVLADLPRNGVLEVAR
jgi:UDP-2,3-diacylglucosamine pyrophosphatase LpxH